jgi:diadenylate cyclase
MSEFLDSLRENFQQFDASAALDVLIISLMFFWVFMLLKGTTAMAVVRGAFIVLIAAVVFIGLLIALPIIFREEIRRALERVGRAGARAFGGSLDYDETIETVAEAAGEMARNKVGALMVMERETGLQDYVETGIPVDALPTPELLEGIFYPNSPLHDGAVVLRGNRVVAAGCTLPLSDNTLPGELGTRHRAGLGITERTDAVSVVVSEETGRISVAADGRMYTRLDDARLKGLLDRLFGERNGTAS